MKIKKFDDLNEANQGKDTKIKVKHLIEYLSKFDPETEVLLDHDGWMAEYTPHKDELDLIEKRGIFDPFEDILIINN